MVNEIIERHHGFIEVESAPGKGSVFTVRWRNAGRTGRSVAVHQHRSAPRNGLGQDLLDHEEVRGGAVYLAEANSVFAGSTFGGREGAARRTLNATSGRSIARAVFLAY